MSGPENRSLLDPQFPEAPYDKLTRPLETPDEKERFETVEPYGGHAAPKPTGIKRFLTKYYTTPLTVVVVQAVLLIVAWGFFGMTRRKPVPLPPSTAVWVSENFQPVTMLVSLAASFTAVVSTKLYGKAILYAIARFLPSGVSLYTIAMSSRISKGSPIRKLSRPLWFIAAGIMAIVLNFFSAGLVTLALPKTIEVKSNMSGFEIDMRSSAFQSLFATNNQTGAITVDLFNRIIPVTETSGSAAAGSHFGFPSYLSVNGFTYINSTAGILPVPIQPVNSNILSARGQQIPTNNVIEQTNQVPPPGQPFPVRFTVTQQGFSASVNCSQPSLDATTTPSLELDQRIQPLFDGTNLTFAQLEVGCDGPLGDRQYSEPVLTNGGTSPDAVLAVTCEVDFPNGVIRNDIVLKGFGIYQDIETTICSVYPELNYVDVSYADTSALYNTSTPSFLKVSEARDATPAQWLGDFAVNVFLRGIKIAQTTTVNSMGDTVITFMRSVSTANGEDAQNAVLEQYIRGVLELSVTLLRTLYTQEDNGLFENGSSVMPQNMRSSINGTFYATTIGWYQDTRTAPAVLIAPTMVFLTSIAIIFFTLFSASPDPDAKELQEFDTGDILHLMAASSAGGLKMTFPSYKETNVDKELGRVRVSFGEIEGHPGRFGFVTDETKRVTKNGEA